jgi:hypothetical protein
MPFGMKTPRRCHWVNDIKGFQPKEERQRPEGAAWHQPNGNALGYDANAQNANKNNQNSPQWFVLILGRDAMHGVSTGESGNKFGPQRKNPGSIMRGFKSAVTTKAQTLNIPFAWQSGFHDKVICDDKEFRRIAAYIEKNPINWENDKLNTKNE